MPSILVTGTSRGIGKATAEALRARGALVIGHSSRPGGDPEAIAADFADPPAPQMLWQEALDRAGGEIDVLVNNAGISLSAPLQRTGTEDLQRVMQVNAVAPYVLCRALIPRMAEAGGGRVINIGSIASLKGIRYTSAYCASKHALLGLTRALAVEWGKRNVTVNAVCPGWTETDMFTRALESVVHKTGRSPEQAREAILASNPMGRPVPPEEVAELVLYLSSPAAAGLTGAALPVDSGESA